MAPAGAGTPTKYSDCHFALVSRSAMTYELIYYYDRYKHAVYFNDNRFNKAFSMVQGYDTNSKDKKEDIFLSGLLSKNIFYEKQGEGK
jgi:hypothetical protein